MLHTNFDGFCCCFCLCADLSGFFVSSAIAHLPKISQWNHQGDCTCTTQHVQPIPHFCPHGDLGMENKPLIVMERIEIVRCVSPALDGSSTLETSQTHSRETQHQTQC